MILETIISGGQTGADQAGWIAAKLAGLKTDGWMPKCFKTEEGPRPEFAEKYGAREHPSPYYPDRTASNVGLAEATILFNVGEKKSPGTIATLRACDEVHQLNFIVIVRVQPNGKMEPKYHPSHVVEWIKRNRIKLLNVAGNRGSGNPGIGAFVESYLTDVFKALETTK